MLGKIIVWTVLCGSLDTAFAQGEVQPGPGSPSIEEPRVVDGKITLNGIEFQVGPCTSGLGTNARLKVPEGLLLTASEGTRRFLELTHNPANGDEIGLIQAENWFAVFAYEETGHVKDDEKDDIDPDEMLDLFKEGNKRGNEARRARGWEPVELVGWHKPPFYDQKTNNLTWATVVRGKSGESINWTTKLLGRTGTMSVELVVGPEAIDAAMPVFDALIEGFEYTEGHKYAEFRSGDKVAEYGLTALVAGGAGVVAFKTGLLATLWKFIGKIWYLILAGVAALFSGIKKALGVGKKETSESTGG